MNILYLFFGCAVILLSGCGGSGKDSRNNNKQGHISSVHDESTSSDLSDDYKGAQSVHNYYPFDENSSSEESPLAARAFRNRRDKIRTTDLDFA